MCSLVEVNGGKVRGLRGFVLLAQTQEGFAFGKTYFIRIKHFIWL